MAKIAEVYGKSTSSMPNKLRVIDSGNFMSSNEKIHSKRGFMSKFEEV